MPVREPNPEGLQLDLAGEADFGKVQEINLLIFATYSHNDERAVIFWDYQDDGVQPYHFILASLISFSYLILPLLY